MAHMVFTSIVILQKHRFVLKSCINACNVITHFVFKTDGLDYECYLLETEVRLDLIPLLKQLIAMLESGQSFVAAPATSGANINIYQGDLKISGTKVTQPAVHSQGLRAIPSASVSKPVAVTTTRLVQHDAGHMTSTLTPVDSLNADIIVMDRSLQAD